MPKITQVERQKKNPRRFNIFLDGVFGFGADEDTVVNQRLLVGKVLDQEALDKVLFETEVGKLMDRLYGLLGRRARSEKEMRDYLKTLAYKRKAKDLEPLSEVAIEYAITRLKQKGLLNDLAFAEAWVESRSKKMGPMRLKQELYLKGVDREIVEEVISHQSSVVSEDAAAERLLERKWGSLGKLPVREAKQKGIQFLMRKGYSYDVSKRLVEKVVEKG